MPPFRLIPGVSAIPSDPSATIQENVNRQAAVMIQIETLEAIDNLDDILTQVPEIDCVWPGLLDIRVSMGLEAPAPPDRPLEPEFLAAMDKFESILRKHDKPRAGQAFGSPEEMMRQGKNNSLSFVAADVAALGQLGQMIPVAREMFPAERKMRNGAGEQQQAKAEGNGEAKGPKTVVAGR